MCDVNNNSSSFTMDHDRPIDSLSVSGMWNNVKMQFGAFYVIKLFQQL